MDLLISSPGLIDLQYLDYFLVQRLKRPILLIKNSGKSHESFGVSAFLEMNDFRSVLYFRYDYAHHTQAYSSEKIIVVGAVSIAISAILMLAFNTWKK